MIYVLLIANNRNSVQVTHNSFQNGKIEVVSRKVSTKTECIYSYTTSLLLWNVSVIDQVSGKSIVLNFIKSTIARFEQKSQ
jgi:hypothetical protein